MKVIADHGVEGLTHRLVASQAEVPLSATSYYFGSIENLLIAAMTDAATQDVERLRSRFDDLAPDADITEAITEAIVAMFADSRRNAVAVTELYTAAVRRKELRDVAILWEQSWFELLSPRIGEAAATAVGAATGGIVQSALLREETPTPEAVRAIIAQVLEG